MSRRVWAIAAVVVALQVALAGRYGWHRDELYFVACGRRLAWGYVDQPPFTPFVARVATGVFGHSLYGLRLLPALANGAVIVLAAMTARELGGGRRAETLAALGTATASAFLGMGHLLETATFDLLAWTATVLLVVRALRTGRGTWWLWAGAVAGVGLENKHSVAFLLAGVFVALLLTQREVLRSPWVWGGAAVALALWAPNLVWQAQHGWPVVAMSRSLHDEGVRDANALLFLPAQVLFLNPALAPLWITGLWWLLRDRSTAAFRAVGLAWVLLAAVFVLSSGKPYYLAGLYPALLAAGAVAAERRSSALARRRYLVAVVVVGALSAVVALPVLPITVVGDGPIAEVNPEHRESYGWRDFTATVDGVPGAAVFTLNYGEAAALELFGRDRPVYSGHNNEWLWGPPPESARPVVVVGHFSRGYLDDHFVGCRRRAVVRNADGVPNEEEGAPVWRCEGPRRPWAREWPSLRHYTA